MVGTSLRSFAHPTKSRAAASRRMKPRTLAILRARLAPVLLGSTAQGFGQRAALFLRLAWRGRCHRGLGKLPHLAVRQLGTLGAHFVIETQRQRNALAGDLDL